MEGTANEQQRIIDKPWSEIRESFKREPYWQFYQDFLGRLPNIDNDKLRLVQTEDNESAIKNQIGKATPENLLHQLNTADSRNINAGISRHQVKDNNGCEFTTYLKEDYKLFVIGDHEPKLEQNGTLTRLYISLDPRRATDAFFALVQELSNEKALSDIQLCLNLEETREPKISNNSVVIYINNSQESARQQRLNNILAAYQRAKHSKPELFMIDQGGVNGLISSYLASYRLFLDNNLSFVEMPSTVPSYDAGGRQEIESALGVRPTDPHAKRIQALKSASPSGVVWSNKSQSLGFDLDKVPPGTTYESVRQLEVPGLVQRKSYRVVKEISGKSFLEKVNTKE